MRRKEETQKKFISLFYILGLLFESPIYVLSRTAASIETQFAFGKLQYTVHYQTARIKFIGRMPSVKTVDFVTFIQIKKKYALQDISIYTIWV